jgi:hypothetical protein
MFALADEGHRTLFEQLVACVLSIRTRDEVSLLAARRLFAVAPSPAALAALPASRIDELVGDTTFHGAKSRQIREIALATDRLHGGGLPCDEAVLLSFRGVGAKCAHLALGIACAERRISVDIHVHRHQPAGGISEAQRRNKPCGSSSGCCRSGTGSRSMRCWCPSASTCALAGCRSAPPARSWICVFRWGWRGTDEKHPCAPRIDGANAAVAAASRR